MKPKIDLKMHQRAKNINICKTDAKNTQNEKKKKKTCKKNEL